MTYTCTVETPLGPMTAAAEDDALTGLWFIGQRHYPQLAGDWLSRPDHPVFAALRSQLTGYFSGERGEAKLRLAPRGTPFQQSIWDVLRGIPYGKTLTYGEIARGIARDRGLIAMSAQAVGGAVGRNPITILIPCHRVVGFDHRLTGYAGGVERKDALLRLEGVQP